LKTLAWPRLNYVVSTKFFSGLDRQRAIAPRVGRDSRLRRP
jgi:hypothetical protein